MEVIYSRINQDWATPPATFKHTAVWWEPPESSQPNFGKQLLRCLSFQLGSCPALYLCVSMEEDKAFMTQPTRGRSGRFAFMCVYVFCLFSGCPAQRQVSTIRVFVPHSCRSGCQTTGWLPVHYLSLEPYSSSGYGHQGRLLSRPPYSFNHLSTDRTHNGCWLLTRRDWTT